MKLIGITGKAGCGKDTIADILVEDHGFVKMSFALPIKQGLVAMFGGSLDDYEDREKKEQEITGFGVSRRHLAQTLGTEWGRTFVHEDVWVKIAMYRAFDLPDDTKGVVFSDVRFENEARFIRENGILCHVHRDLCGLSGVESSHKSEQGVSVGVNDWMIRNDKTINDLRYHVSELAKC